MFMLLLVLLQVRALQELANIRKRAGWVAGQVAAFWKKAERVVNYKVRGGGWWWLPTEQATNAAATCSRLSRA
jgi:hypothetical protein